MNLDSITDIKELKAMAYDFLAAKEQAEMNFQAVSRRLSRLLEEQNDSKIEEPTTE